MAAINPSTIPDSDKQKLTPNGNEPATALTDVPVVVNIPSDCEIFDDLVKTEISEPVAAVSRTDDITETTRTFRKIWPIDAYDTVGSRLRLKFMQRTGDYTVAVCYIAKQASSGDVWDFDESTQVQIKVGGSASFTIPSGTDVYSDWIEFDTEISTNYIIVIRFTTIAPYGSESTGLYYKVTTSEDTLGDATGYTSRGGYTFGVASVQIRDDDTKKLAIVDGSNNQQPVEIECWEPLSGDPNYPTAHSSTYVKATTELSAAYAPHCATDPTLLLTGSHDSSRNWISSAAASSQKFNVDLGSALVVNRIYFENSHDSGGATTNGAKNFILYGTNEATAFANTTYATTTDLTELATLQAAQHIASDRSDPQYFEFENSTSYRYYVLRIANNWGGIYMGIRHIEFQTQVGAKAVLHTNQPDSDDPLYLVWDAAADDNTLYVGETGGSDDDLFSATHSGYHSDGTPRTYRLSFTGSNLSEKAQQIRLKFGRVTSNTSIGKCYIQYKASGGNSWDFDSTPIQVTVGGETSWTVTADGLLSDPIDLEIDQTKDIVVSIYTGASSAFSYYSGTPTGADSFVKNNVDEADDLAPTGYTDDTNFHFISGIVGVAPAKQVWGSNYSAVYHMAQDPETPDDLLDSTSNGLNGTPTGTFPSGSLHDGAIGKGIDYSNGNYHLCGAVDVADDITIEILHIADQVLNGSGQNSVVAIGVADYQAVSIGPDIQYVIAASSTGSSWTTLVATSKLTADTLMYQTVVHNGTKWAHDVDASGTTEDDIDGSPNYGTKVLKIGAHYSGSYTSYDGSIYELRISKVARSADYLEYQYNSLTDNLFTWGDATLEDRLQYWDQPYGNLTGTNLVYWDQSYALLNYIIGYFDSVYGIQLQRYWDHSYGNSPLVKVFWDLLYGNQKLITKFWDLDYGDRVALIRYWDQKYNIRKAIEQHWDQRYSIMGKEILTYWDQEYDVKNTNPLMKFFDQYYHIVADSVVESAALGFYIDGVRYEGPYHVSWELNVDSFKNTGEMHFNYPAPFFAAGEGKEMRIVDTDIDLKLEITIPTKSERTNETLYFIKGESKSRILERAEVFTETFKNTTAATICTTIAARYGITIDWQIPDWPLSEYDINDQTPLQAIRGLTGDDCAKACLQTDFNGDTVSVIKRMESDSHMWDTDTPSYYITDSLHLEQTNQRGEYKKGYNAYRVTDQSSASETRTWIEDEEYADAKREVHVFRVPWDGITRSLYTSDNNATIQYLGVVTEDLEEEFSIVNGEGENKTTKPAYAVVSWSYNDTNLGTPTVTEEGVVQTATEGTSMLTLTYTTRYYKWIVTDYDDPKIQIWVE